MPIQSLDIPEWSPSSLLDLLLELPHHRETGDLLPFVVGRLSALAEIALVRVWVLRPGDICSECPLRSECPDQTTCLHLEASAGQSVQDPGADWGRTDGSFRRFPVGVRKVGMVGGSGQSIIVEDVREDHTWIVHPRWAALEGIRGFAGHPLQFRGETLGVLGAFTRKPLNRAWARWIRVIADHVAGAMVNSRSFEEMEHLKDQLAVENEFLREEVSEANAFGEILGRSAAIVKVGEQIDLVAPTDASVLVQGESGTGKELVSREIHRRSGRAGGPMIKVNCASIPRDLYESEFFGHVKGAFSGAVRDRVGRFEAADGGTIFLDEVGEIPLDLQAKLLRVLQEGEFERIGSGKTVKSDVRILAATNRDLLDEVAAGRFRSDLYYRLNVFPITVPPLRERKSDIALLAHHFVDVASRRFGRTKLTLTEGDVRALEGYSWPGNVRELQNVIERAVISNEGGRFRFSFVLKPSTQKMSEWAPPQETPGIMTSMEVDAFVRDNILRALEAAHWKIYGDDGAAELLGLKPTTLASRMKKLGIFRPGA